MSRAMNLTMSLAETLAACAKAGVTVSAATPIWSGGTRLVLTNAFDSAVMSKLLQPALISGAVQHEAPKAKGATRTFSADTPREQTGWTGGVGQKPSRSPRTI